MDDSVTVPIDLAQIPNEMIGEAFLGAMIILDIRKKIRLSFGGKGIICIFAAELIITKR